MPDRTASPGIVACLRSPKRKITFAASMPDWKNKKPPAGLLHCGRLLAFRPRNNYSFSTRLALPSVHTRCVFVALFNGRFYSLIAREARVYQADMWRVCRAAARRHGRILRRSRRRVRRDSSIRAGRQGLRRSRSRCSARCCACRRPAELRFAAGSAAGPANRGL